MRINCIICYVVVINLIFNTNVLTNRDIQTQTEGKVRQLKSEYEKLSLVFGSDAATCKFFVFDSNAATGLFFSAFK